MFITISNPKLQETTLTRNKKIAAAIIGIVVLAALISLIVCSTQTTSVAEHKASLLKAQEAASTDTIEILKAIGYAILLILCIIGLCAAVGSGGSTGAFANGMIIGSML